MGWWLANITFLCRLKHFVQFLAKKIEPDLSSPITSHTPWGGGWKHHLTVMIRTVHMIPSKEKFWELDLTPATHGCGWKHSFTMEIRTFHTSLAKMFAIDPQPHHILPHGVVAGCMTFLCWSEHFTKFLSKHFFNLTPHASLLLCVWWVEALLYFGNQNISCNS